MARLLGPDVARRTVTQVVGSTVYDFSGRAATVYLDEALTQLAPIATYNASTPNTPGAAIAGSQLTLSARNSRLPLFFFPDGVDTLYVAVSGLSHPWMVTADVDARVDSLTTVAGAALPRSGGTMTGTIVMPGGIRLPMTPPIIRRGRWRDTSGFTEQFQAGHSWVANGAGVASSNVNDTSSFCRGTQSALITTNGTAGQANLQRFANAGLAAVNFAGKNFRIVLKVESGAATLNSLNFFIGTSSLANNFKFILNPTTASSLYVTQGQWVTVTFGWHDLNSAAGTFTATGGVPSTQTGFTDMRVQVLDTTGNPVSLRLQAVEIVDAPASTYPKGVISITFDDSWSSQWDLARPAMDKFGFRGTQYSIVDAVGTTGKLTLSQLHQLQEQSGWEIGGHAYTSAAHTARLTTLTAAQVDEEIGNLKAWLVHNGFDGESFAYPGGQFEQTTDGVWVEDICSRYFSTNRSILGVPLRAIETVPPPMPHRLRAVSSISSVNAVNGMNNPTGMLATGGILDKLAANGGWDIMCFHQVTAGAPTVSTEISVADFTALMQGIADRGIAVIPVSDVQRGVLG